MGTREGRVVKEGVRLVCLILRSFGRTIVVRGGFLESRMIFDGFEFIILCKAIGDYRALGYISCNVVFGSEEFSNIKIALISI